MRLARLSAAGSAVGAGACLWGHARSERAPAPLRADRPVAIVTGASRGVGAATAELLASKKWNIVLNYSQSGAEAAEVAARCTALGARVEVAQGDVASDGDCRRIVQAAVARFGRVDALVNNAGTTKFVPHDDLDGLEAADFQQIYLVNAVGPFQMTRAAAPHLKEAPDAAVVNVSSVAGKYAVGSSLAYVASKGALNALTIGLARSLGPDGVRVNAVLPGFIEGAWLKRGLGAAAYDGAKAWLETTTPLGAVQTPQAVAATIVALLEAPNVTGQLVVIDSGMHLNQLAAAPRKPVAGNVGGGPTGPVRS